MRGRRPWMRGGDLGLLVCREMGTMNTFYRPSPTVFFLILMTSQRPLWQAIDSKTRHMNYDYHPKFLVNITPKSAQSDNTAGSHSHKGIALSLQKGQLFKLPNGGSTSLLCHDQYPLTSLCLSSTTNKILYSRKPFNVQSHTIIIKITHSNS